MEITNQHVIRVKKEYRDKILADPSLQGKIAKNINKSVYTIYRWTKGNKPELTMLTVINTIREHLHLGNNDTITEHTTLEKAA